MLFSYRTLISEQHKLFTTDIFKGFYFYNYHVPQRRLVSRLSFWMVGLLYQTEACFVNISSGSAILGLTSCPRLIFKMMNQKLFERNKENNNLKISQKIFSKFLIICKIISGEGSAKLLTGTKLELSLAIYISQFINLFSFSMRNFFWLQHF